MSTPIPVNGLGCDPTSLVEYHRNVEGSCVINVQCEFTETHATLATTRASGRTWL
jgi:hypothetical protein